MQPSPLPGKIAQACVRLLLLLVALHAVAAPATALATQGTPVRFMGEMVYVGRFGIGYVDVTYDLNAQHPTAVACIEHDPNWNIGPGTDEDGNRAFWVPTGVDESEGSEKATMKCIQLPPDVAEKLPDLPAVEKPDLLLPFVLQGSS